VMDADGENERNITNAPDSDDTHPAWSPDGTNIAYTASRRVANSPALRLLNVATGETTLLSVEGRGDVAWSPGGTQLAFHHFDRDRGSWGIVVMTARRGGKRRRVVEMDRWHPTRGLVWVDVGHIAHLSPTNVRAIHTMDLAGRPQSPVYVEAGAPIHAFDWVDPARPVRPAGKRPTTLGGLKAGEDVW